MNTTEWTQQCAERLHEQWPRVDLSDLEHLAEALLRDGENRELLPGFALGPQLTPSAELSSVLPGSSMVVVAVPSQAVRETLTAAADLLG